MEITASENDQLKKKTEEETNMDYSFPVYTSHHERLIMFKIMQNFSAAVSI